ncbi:hypothetical protein CJ030_MR8G006118 [Morella rubra]|uniref:Uncharacterized protein n=1 Tax=Morella rubra TaxID=262757 RepID=A0A6A1UQQ8_9ROSI|nr:hypothetical protein CJ030_MR8G006118 [Morella rubra]
MPLAVDCDLEGKVPTKTYVSNHTHLTSRAKDQVCDSGHYSQPTECVLFPPEGEVGFFNVALHAGARFPLSREVRELLDAFSLAATQLAPNGWRLALVKCEEGMYFFKAKGKRAIFHGFPSNNKGWRDKFFFVSRDGWKYPLGEEYPLLVARAWGVPLTPRIKVKRSKSTLKSKGLVNAFPMIKSWHVVTQATHNKTRERLLARVTSYNPPKPMVASLSKLVIENIQEIAIVLSKDPPQIVLRLVKRRRLIDKDEDFSSQSVGDHGDSQPIGESSLSPPSHPGANLQGVCDLLLRLEFDPLKRLRDLVPTALAKGVYTDNVGAGIAEAACHAIMIQTALSSEWSVGFSKGFETGTKALKEKYPQIDMADEPVLEDSPAKVDTSPLVPTNTNAEPPQAAESKAIHWYRHRSLFPA